MQGPVSVHAKNLDVALSKLVNLRRLERFGVDFRCWSPTSAPSMSTGAIFKDLRKLEFASAAWEGPHGDATDLDGSEELLDFAAAGHLPVLAWIDKTHIIDLPALLAEQRAWEEAQWEERRQWHQEHQEAEERRRAREAEEAEEKETNT